MATEHDINVGICVTFRYGSEHVMGRVTEDRGPIGRGGRRLYVVKFQAEPGFESVIELPADELEVSQHSLRR